MYHQRRNDNEERRARLAFFVLKLFPNIMQCSVSYYILKNGLSNKYCNNKRNPPVFTPTELLLIKQLPTVQNFTIQLCYKLISFEELLPSPSSGWGMFPDSKAVKVEDDIRRIRHVINEIIEINNDECTESYLVKFLYKLEQIIQRFQSALGNTNVLQTYKTLLIQNIDTTVVLAELKNVGVIDSNVQHIKLQDRERYSKISAVIIEFFPKILRNLIPSGITPFMVHILCTMPSCKWDKSQSLQIQKLKLNLSFESLDASMLYQLFRRFSFVTAPTQGWGREPTNRDFEIADDIERIRLLRNKSAHRCDTCIDQTEFDNYFLQFHEITQRIAVSYEHELTAIAVGSLDPNRQIALMEALQELEDIKERFKKTPVRYYWGNDFEKKIMDIRQMIQSRKDIRGQKTTLIEKLIIKIDLQDITYAETKEKILNELKKDINEGDFQIEFIGASTGSLILYAYTSTEALTTDGNLQTELSSFMRRILYQGRFEILSSQWIDAVIFPVEDNKELTLNSSTTKSLSLQFNVNMDVFETDARLESEIGSCMQRTIKNLNGKGFTEDVTAIIDYMQSADTEDKFDIETSQLVPVENIEIDKESTVVSGTFDKDFVDNTEETLHMESIHLSSIDKSVEITEKSKHGKIVSDKTEETLHMETSHISTIDKSVEEDRAIVSDKTEETLHMVTSPMSQINTSVVIGDESKTFFFRAMGTRRNLYKEKKRWLIAGICLHSIVAPMIRKYVDHIISNLYNSLVSTHSINTQGYHAYLQKYPAANACFLNYESINRNRHVPMKKVHNKWINNYQKYDYKVTSHVDLSKLFLQPGMTHYSAIDESCDLSALLSMVINISSFQPAVQTVAEKIRTEICCSWPLCEYLEWTANKYIDSFDLMIQLAKEVGLNNKDKNRIFRELNTWATNGKTFQSGERLGFEIVEEIRQQTHILNTCLHTLCTETESQLVKAETELLENELENMLRSLESKTKKNTEQLIEHKPLKRIQALDSQRLVEELLTKVRRTIDFGYKPPDTKPRDQSKEYISSNLLRFKEPTSVCLEKNYEVSTMKDLSIQPEYISSNLLRFKEPTSVCLEKNYEVSTMKDLSIQPGFKEADKFICGKCGWLTVSLDEFFQHRPQCKMQQEENEQVKDEYKKYVVARITVPTKDQDLSSKIEKEWQQGNIHPRHSSLEVNHITTGSVVIWVKVDVLLSRTISKFYSALDNLVNDIFQKYADNLPLYRVQVYDIATGYVDNLTDKFSCGDYELKCYTLEKVISHKKTMCFQHVLPENGVSLLVDIKFNQTDGPNSSITLESRNVYAKGFVNEIQKKQPFTIMTTEGDKEVSGISTQRKVSTQWLGISNEEENYVRMSLLLTRISPRAVRSYFDYKFAPACLDASLNKEYNKLLDLKKERRINQSQWFLLFTRFPACKYILNKKMNVKAIQRLGGQQMKQECDYMRTKSLYQTKQEIMMDIKYSHSDILELKEFFASLKQSHTEMKKSHVFLQVNHSVVTKEMEEIKISQKDTVPWNIRVRINHTLQAWKDSDDKMFINTKVAQYVHICIQENSCVTITASFGAGKTSTLRHTALQLAKEEYDVLLVTEPSEILRFYNPDKKTLFVIDDLCGNFSVDQSDIKIWKTVNEDIKQILDKKQTKILAACRLQVYQDEEFDSLSVFKSCVCNILSEGICLSKIEKLSIAKLYFKTKASEIGDICNSYDCFPLLCKLCYDNPELNVADFFQNPFSVYEAEIDTLRNKGYYTKYCALALCVMFNNKLNEELLTEDVNEVTKTIIQNTCEACKLDRETSRIVLQNELDLLAHTFIKKKQNVYKFINDKIFDFLSYFFGQKIVHCLIKNADYDLIKKRFLLERKDGMDELITIIPLKYHDMYIQRMIDDWSKGKVQGVFGNINMKIPQFRQKFLAYLKTLNISYQRQLANICDNGKPLSMRFEDDSGDVTYDTALLNCCHIGDISLIEWCFNHEVNVYRCAYYGRSPIMIGCVQGHIEVVKLLLDRGADYNKVDVCAKSPAMKACEYGHTEIIKMLLDKGVDCNQFDCKGVSLIMKACKVGQTEIAKMLLDKGADCNKCDDKGQSPLELACEQGYTEIVKMLLESGADCNKCDIWGDSPIMKALHHGHAYTEIVKMLLDRRADCNICTRRRQSSLIKAACRPSHTDIVNTLLDRGADCNICDNLGQSPVKMDCEYGDTDIVQTLLDRVENYIKCSRSGQSILLRARGNRYTEIIKNIEDPMWGVSPVMAACYPGHTGIILNMLLHRGADCNTCDRRDQSLFIKACENGCTEIVRMLLDRGAHCYTCERKACKFGQTEIAKIFLDKGANCNRCDNKGQSPVEFACEQSNTEIVKMLLESGADCNKCDILGHSPVMKALHYGLAYTEIVKMLLESGANCNKCDIWGRSPVMNALHHGHAYAEIVKMLLDRRADYNICNRRGQSSLMKACRLSHTEILVNMLSNRGADCNRCDNPGQSSVKMACEYGHTDIIQTLLDRGANYRNYINLKIFENGHTEIVLILLDTGADYDKCDVNDESPLMMACYRCHIEIDKLLLDIGADCNKYDRRDQSLAIKACRNGHTDIVRMLLDVGAHCNTCDRRDQIITL